MKNTNETLNQADNSALHKTKVSTRLSIGSNVWTPYGSGGIVEEEVFRTCQRWGVKLDNNPFSFPIAFFFKKEVEHILDSCHCIFEYNDLSPLLVWQCPKCDEGEKSFCKECGMEIYDCCCSDLMHR
ncbi:MAG TPA: hypothetical protein VKZ45_01500 [Vicingaceae bacterium]|nr:hypothetical protein [Vicingaceae bacterium]